MEHPSAGNFNFSVSIPVRFADCDILGHVNHAKMFTYMEEVRAQYLGKVLGMRFTPSETAPGRSALLAQASCTYQSPAKFGETLLIKTRTLKIGKSSFVMDYEIHEEKTSRPVAVGQTVGVFFDFRTQKSAPLPPSLREKVEKFEKRSFAVATA